VVAFRGSRVDMVRHAFDFSARRGSGVKR